MSDLDATFIFERTLKKRKKERTCQGHGDAQSTIHKRL